MKAIINVGVIVVIIIVATIGIFFSGNLDINENVNVVSESEQEKIQHVDGKNNDKLEKEKDIKNTQENTNIVKEVTIFVSGEVNNPGVVTINSDKRLADAVNKLGGFTQDADLNKINLAMKIEDEKHYIIPKIGENIEVSSSENSINTKNEENNLVNINEADIKELDSLPGVGEATATKIINYREEKGKFKSTEEIKDVNGIGDKKYENIKDMITIK
ncbi:helix-hairpin-helix domain-containing protein [Romboutsia lituseburensis]|uniref:helix-hairpin-helix domain-containing protein n=1 Tax=Romboutsia lituseburensis TaxID=1537 RepID=UPI00215A89AA|nr:helix-hairpin-helix domain-containing protein [Romboutsia lituseburensis]MCR8746536.1 helix-hairpin-helix domain-containing protein [Romboutsia lituseburensis]